MLNTISKKKTNNKTSSTITPSTTITTTKRRLTTFRKTTPAQGQRHRYDNRDKKKKEQREQREQRESNNDNNHLTQTFSELSLNTTPSDPSQQQTQQRKPRDYVDARDKPGYKDRMADKTRGNTYTNPTIFGVEHGTATGKSYSNNFRPKWVMDLDESFAKRDLEPADPNLAFPQFSTTATQNEQHWGFKIPMSYSSEVHDVFDTAANIKYKPVKAQKPNLVFYISYRGTGYQGLQVQFSGEKRTATLKTIEGDLLDAFVASGYISEQNADAPHKIKWSRAARTDKGVHAATNILNGKLRIPFCEAIPEVMYVKKKALKYASGRSTIIIPIATTLLTNLITTPVDGKSIPEEVEDDVADVEDVVEDLNVPIDDTPKPILLTTTKSALLSLIPNNVAVDILGNITISPNMIYTLKKFGIVADDGAEIDNLITQSSARTDEIKPPHTFTPWEHKLMHLVAQFGSEWDGHEGGDDDDEEAGGNDGEKKERGGDDRNDNNNNNNNNKPIETDPNSPLLLPIEEQNKILLARGIPAKDLDNLSKRRREMVLQQGYQDPKQSARRRNQQKVPYIRQMGWLDEYVSHLSNPDFLSDCIQTRMRKHLPNQFHFVRAVKVASSFDAKLQASSRTYEYIIPSFAFMPISKYPADIYENMLKAARKESFQATADRDMAAVMKGQELEAGDDEDEDGGKQKGKKGGRNNNNNKKNDQNKVGNPTDNIQKSEWEMVDGDAPTTNDQGDDVVQQQFNTNAKRLRPAGLDADDGELLTDDKTTTTTTTTATSITTTQPPQSQLQAEFTPPKELLDYKLSAQDLVDIQFTLSHFLGTRSHHNFTSGKKFTDPSSRRFIRSFKPIGTFMVGNVEFVHMCVHGDSFLLHQIRKMVGFSMSIMRGNYNDIPLTAERQCYPDDRLIEPYAAALGKMANDATATAIGASNNGDDQIPTLSPSPHLVDVSHHAFAHVFSKDRYNIPPAPALGLLLDHVHYDTHDFKCATMVPVALKSKNFGHLRETLFASYQRVVPFVLQIKQREIYPEIAIQEMTTSNAWKWLHLLNLLDFQSAKLDNDGIPISQKHNINHNLTKTAKKGVVDVHGHDSAGGAGIQYVQLDSTTTAAIPTFVGATSTTTDGVNGTQMKDGEEKKD